jgi:hypothetical protein
MTTRNQMQDTGTLRLRWHADGLEVLQADAVVEVDELLLEALDAADSDTNAGRKVRGVHYGDGILTIEGVNRTVSYGIGRPDAQRRTRMAYLSGTMGG